MTFPADENGDVLRRMQSQGVNFAKARDIDFNHVFESEEKAKCFLEAVRKLGYLKSSDEFEKETRAWGVLVKILSLPTHSGITEEESKLDSLARQFGGRADGWGSMRTD